MGLISIIKSIITFPFRLIARIFGRKKESVEPTELPPLPPPPSPTQPAPQTPQNVPQPTPGYPAPVEQPEPQRVGTDRTTAKLDLILAELDNLKIMNQTLTERLNRMERKLEERRGIRYV